ncbi:MAG: hypothetical protein VX505_01290 [Chloroflexota bacterium]|nr:hypothetical protein [Chloroflexota bacterium]
MSTNSASICWRTWLCRLAARICALFIPYLPKTRMDMNSEPPYQAVDNEIAYRWREEVTAMGKLNDA